jgi:hypothetical protein
MPAQTSITINPTDSQLAALAGAAKTDRPFWGFSVGPATVKDSLSDAGAQSRGIQTGLLRPSTNTSTDGTKGVLDPTNLQNLTLPYQQKDLLRKIFNSVTTRSNVFAVWLTVGYFEVAKDSNGNYVGDQPQPIVRGGVTVGTVNRPVLLGQELGKSENRAIRHRMFAIIDRTNLQLWPTQYINNQSVPTIRCVGPTAQGITVQPDPTQANFTGQSVKAQVQLQFATGSVPPGWRNLTNAQGTPVPINNPRTYTNPYTGTQWRPQVGSVIVFDPDTDNEETVVLQQVNLAGGGVGLQATFTKSHARNCPVISRGNPGPWAPVAGNTHPLGVDPRLDAGGVIQYFAMLN